jgi:hypothetical protein
VSFGFNYDDEPGALGDDGGRPESRTTVRQSLSFRRAIYRVPPDPVGEDLEARLCALTADGTPLGDHRKRSRSRDVGDPNYEKRFGELMDLARVLVGAGLDARVASIDTMPEPFPDFRLRLTDARTVYAEVGRILVPSAAALTNGVTALRRGIRRREDASRRFQLSLGGSWTTLTLARPLGKRVAQAVDETEALLRWIAADADDGARMIDGTRFPVLHSVGATCDVIRHQWRIYGFDIQAAPPKWDPAATKAAFAKLRADKARKRNGYPVSEPVWLVMPLADEFESTETVLGALRADMKDADPRPFDLVAVGSIDEAIFAEAPRR